MTSTLFIFDLDDTLVHTTRDMRGDHERISNLKLLRGMRMLLLSLKGQTILLTAGDHELQQKKIEHLQLGSLFTEVHIVQNRQEKEAVLRDLVARVQMHPSRVVVVGDRIDHEIRYGNQLGCTTVRMRLKGGKYADLVPESGFDLPIYEVGDAAELAELVLTLL